MLHLSSAHPNFSNDLNRLLAFESVQDPAIDTAVAAICDEVKRRGDAAVLDYTNTFDQVAACSMAELTLSPDDLSAAHQRLTPTLKEALQLAAERVRHYHERQLLHSWSYEDEDGSLLGQQVTPLARVGIYVPGGKAFYPSSVLMNAIPAKVAGVQEIVMVVPAPRGERNDMVLAAAHIAGVDRVFTIGGAQAIAALAYGTSTIAAVDKVIGPGNAWVAAAKRRVFGVVGIDMVAGPSEILIICDGSTAADWIAMDLFSQAEHDEMAQAILLCPCESFIAEVQGSIKKLLPTMPRRAIIEASLMNRGALITVRDMHEACVIANHMAPEHLELSVTNPEDYLPYLRNAGAIFLGRFTSESLGDYCAGPNHVLPTSRSARFASPLGVYDFQKRTSLIRVSPLGAQRLGSIAALLAHEEGLSAHACAAQMRLKD